MAAGRRSENRALAIFAAWRQQRIAPNGGQERVQPKRKSERFYDSRQGFCETRRIEFCLVGIHGPSGAGDASGQPFGEIPWPMSGNQSIAEIIG